MYITFAALPNSSQVSMAARSQSASPAPSYAEMSAPGNDIRSVRAVLIANGVAHRTLPVKNATDVLPFELKMGIRDTSDFRRSVTLGITDYCNARRTRVPGLRRAYVRASHHVLGKASRMLRDLLEASLAWVQYCDAAHGLWWWHPSGDWFVENDTTMWKKWQVNGYHWWGKVDDDTEFFFVLTGTRAPPA